jgi:hypothetical protein
MRKIIGVSSLLAFAVLLLLQTSITSCTKEELIHDTVTVIRTDTLIVTDTLVIKDTAISLELLTANSWQLQEIRGVNGNTLLFYQRGGSSNTENYDPEYITFNTNKTGMYNDGHDHLFSIIWDFLNSEKTKLTFTIINLAPAPDQTVIYENLRYKNGALWFDQYWTIGGINHHGQVIRTPKQ